MKRKTLIKERYAQVMRRIEEWIINRMYDLRIVRGERYIEMIHNACDRCARRSGWES